jgi:hypothetical protein
MLGVYDNFPNAPHKTAHFTTSVPTKKLQQTLIQVLSEINGKTLRLEDIADPSVPQCTVILELGIADATNFNYLDNEETTKTLRRIQKTPLQIIDLYCAVRYYTTRNEKKTHLRFDYYLMRNLFQRNSMETRIFHEKGPTYVTPEDIINLVENKINNKCSKKMLKPQ